MQAYINDFLQIIGYNLPGFRHGVEISLAGVLIFIIILKVLGFLLFSNRQKKCSGIFVESEKGRFYISRQAVADLVKSKEIEVPGLSIHRTFLMKKRKAYSVRVVAELNDKDGIFPELVMSLQKKVLSALNDNLGIDSIKRVDIDLKRVNSAATI
ncbi:MAG: hypothetical protein WCR55_00955 [Lentisphaerota bacterium]